MKNLALLGLFVICINNNQRLQADPLPSWNDGPNKQTIIEFVKDATNLSSPSYIPPPDRIAVFDNDGTLWCEKPEYPQYSMALKYFGLEKKTHPKLEGHSFKKDLERTRWFIIDGAIKTVRRTYKIFRAIGIGIDLYRGMPYDEYTEEVKNLIATSLHPRFKRPYTETIYQPMLELIQYLRANDFKVFIVTAGGMDFVREFSVATYGVDTDNVVGYTTEFESKMKDGRLTIIRKVRLLRNILTGRNKPVNIQRHIGKRPVIAVGNANGDLGMLLFSERMKYPSLSMLIHHDDAEREYKYRRGARRVLRKAKKRGWSIISMKNDWKTIFPFEKEDKGSNNNKL